MKPDSKHTSVQGFFTFIGFSSSHVGRQLFGQLLAVFASSHGVSDVVHATSLSAEGRHQLSEGFQDTLLFVVFSCRFPLTASIDRALQLLLNGHGTVFVQDGTQRARDVAFEYGQLRSAIMGLGFTVLPMMYCEEELASGRLVQLLPQWSLPGGWLQAVYPHRRGVLPAIRAWIDYLEEGFKGCGDRLL